MKKEIIRLLARSREESRLDFVGEEKKIYEKWLDGLIEQPMYFCDSEIETVWSFVVRSVKNLSDICIEDRIPEQKYRGCMENAIFLMEYLLHYYHQRVKRDRLEDVIRITKEKLEQAEERVKKYHYTNRLVKYYKQTGLVEKIQFYLEYYFGE